MHTNSGSILVVGGAGYIGSHMVLALQEAGWHVVVLDNLSKGYRDAVIDAELVVGDMADKQVLQRLFQQYPFEAVMHFGALIEVGESVRLPALYYQNNLLATLQLLDVMREHQVNRFIFSSTAAVYGEPQYTPIDELHPRSPINPYGRSKSMVEDILHDYARAYGLQFAILRYFNAAGSDPLARIGERHEPESHLIPLVLQVAAGKRDHIRVNGRDYPTPDGTCIRDYIHVSDICSAHLLALQSLLKHSQNIVCNLGNGVGYSVQQVIKAARRVTGHVIPVMEGERRLGDPAILVADATWARRELQWNPSYPALDDIVSHAWRYMQQVIIAD
jgi:UDP-glucose 4-epimerase